MIIVNPEILSESGKKDIKKESCLSVPRVRGPVERRDKIQVKYQDRYGEFYTSEFSGFQARVIMHEIDHLNGILFVDRLLPNSQLEPLDLKWE